jgi:arylsulfatase A-like enzyme/Tfp pilus assembly protein PilF
MKKTWIISIIIAAAAAAALLYFLVLPPGEFNAARKARDFNVVLITIDTLRADRIGCYGYDGVETPTMDMFARRGVKFDNCTAVTPLTLPSHTSILTGTYPTFHGVRDNGGFLVPDPMLTLAELFQQQDYATSAFVASYVLDSKWGINQGFDHYFDHFDLSKYKTISLGNVQRPGNEVMDQALPWLESHKEAKFFSWIHLYDPHTPYEPPSPYAEMYPNRPYVGEIAFTDYQLSRLWDFLESSGLVDNTLVIFLADHGESLGEHKESAHGFFIYEEAVHVPLIFVTPFEKMQGLTRATPVSLVDVMPTILDMTDMAIPAEVQGRSLMPDFTRENAVESTAYAETFYPRFHYGWSELQSVQDGRFKLIRAPRLELYDLKADPDEMVNLVDERPADARRLLNRLESFITASSEDAYELDYTKMDEETRQKLSALGYIGTFSASESVSGRNLGDPKDKIDVFNQLSHARELSLRDQFDEAVAMVENIIQDDPNVVDAYFTLGNLYFKWGKFEEALDSFSQALELKPNDSFVMINIANSHVQLNQLEEAKAFLLDAVETVDPDSQIFLILGNIHNSLDEDEKALEFYQKCIDINPASASAFNAMAGIHITHKNLDESRRYLERAQEINPELPNLFYHYAQLYEEMGDITKAEQAYQQELEHVPHNFRAMFNLSRLYRLQGKPDLELEYLEKTIETNPRFPMSYFYKARIYLNREEKYAEAIEWVKKGIEMEPKKKDLPLGYFLLADLYNRVGDMDKSQEYARKGEEASRETENSGN